MMYFKSKVDWWFFLVVVVVTGFLCFTLVPLILSGQMPVLYFIGILLLSAGIPVWLLFSTGYWVDAEKVRVRAGPFTWIIPIKDIDSVRPSRALWSSPAMSFDRILIRYAGKRRILLSPADKKGFRNAIGQPDDND